MKNDLEVMQRQFKIVTEELIDLKTQVNKNHDESSIIQGEGGGMYSGQKTHLKPEDFASVEELKMTNDFLNELEVGVEKKLEIQTKLYLEQQNRIAATE